MADDLMASNFDPQARYAALDERVTNLRTSFVNLEGEMRSGFVSLNAHMTAMSNELRSSQKTQWPVIWAAAGVVFSILIGIGGALYWPVLNNISDLKIDVKDLRGSTIPREEIEARTKRAAEDRARLDVTISDLREQVNHQVDQRFAEVQRQIDDIKGGDSSRRTRF